MSCRLPAMIYSAPLKEDTIDLDFGEQGKNGIVSVRRKIKRKREPPEDHQYSQWNNLPDIILEDIFSLLSIRERYYASQVCRNWNRIFYSPRVWNTFVLEDRTLTRRKFNYYMGDQHVLDHHRTQICLNRMARGFRHIVIAPMENFFNLYEFMTILSYYSEYLQQEPLDRIRSLDFTFGCDFSGEESVDRENKVFGTGGKLLEALKRMMDILTGLRHLSLQDLFLEKEDAKYLLDDVAYNCCETLRSLCLVNCCKEPYAMLHVAVFVNLQRLTLSPQHLGEDIVSLLPFCPRLRDLHLLQTRQREPLAVPVAEKVWRECARRAPLLRVHHVVKGKLDMQVIWQEGAPVYSVIYNTPFSQVNLQSALTISSLYCRTLETYAHISLPQFHMPREFDDRADASLMLLARSCPNLHTLVIRERVSTATLLLLAYHSRSLRRLVVRISAVIKKCEWPPSPEWTDRFYEWLKVTSRSYDTTMAEISRILDCQWTMLTDKEFASFRLA